MKKKIIAMILAVALIITSIIVFPLGSNPESGGIVWPEPVVGAIAAERSFGDAAALAALTSQVTPISISEALADQTPRDGYILAPTIFGATGVDPISTFVLRTPAGYGDDTPAISIDGQPLPTIAREDDNTFIIAPAIPLTSNSVYTFRISREENNDITWAFQTTVTFEISSTLPRNQSTNVPVRTGIEIVFSFGENIIIEDYFSIYPRVEGRFTTRGSSTIFMPTSALEFGQIYTVTVRAGLSAPGTSDVIASDLSFSFETEPESAQVDEQIWHSNLHFLNRHVEFPSFAAPSVSFWVNFSEGQTSRTIDMSVYRFDNRAQAIAAINRKNDVPHWAWVAHNDNLVNTSGMENVHSSRFTITSDDHWGANDTFTLPNNLPPGFYVLNASFNNADSQVIIQITDMAVQIIADDNRALVWVNDMTTGQPVAGARVFDSIANRTFETSQYGIAVVERGMSAGESLIITADDGKESVVFAHSFAFQHFWRWTDWDIMPHRTMGGGFWGGWQTANSNYWSVLQLDRTLFQRSDTVSLWGFVQNRRQEENINFVTAVLTERTWWWDAEDETLHRQNIPVVDGSYHAEIRLPNLSPGSYELTIYHGGVALNTVFFSVMDYVTPPYRLSVAASKNAIFAGEEVTFTANTAFFEGTPVPDLEVNYHFWGWELNTPGGGTRTTDSDGNVTLSARPTASGTAAHGERSLDFMVEATLPEIGWVHQHVSTRVFINDIHLRPEASRDGSDATLSVDVHNITLDRLNDGTSERWNDFLDTPRAGQRISVQLVEVYWVAIRTGERWDHITRQVVPRYRYESRERLLERFEIVTDEDGFAEKDFQVPNIERRSYKARLTTTDGNGRQITMDVFIGRDFTHFFWDAEGEMFLDGVQTRGYEVGDEVELTIMQGTEPVTQGNFLFVVVQDGIMSYHMGTNPLRFTFGERHVPNAQVFAFHFNGHIYTSGGQMSQQLLFNPADRELSIEVTTNQEYYRPGDLVTFTVSVTDTNGNPKAANVNISLVDEALFALMDYSVDTLAMLYARVNDRLRFSTATHRTFISDGIEGLYGAGMVTASADMAPAPASPAPAAEAMATTDDTSARAGGDEARIRERFEDTAIFRSVRTNAQGEATFTARLPDNITSWRVTASAVNEDLYAGNTIQNLRVTQPMFLHYTLGSVFLVGDTPYIGVNAFGTSLSGGEQVTFEVWREDMPADIRRATGVAFARVNIPLWEKTAEGFGAIIVRATVGGFGDAVRHPYQVLNSHRQVDIARFYEVTPATVFDVNPGGLTNITFTDLGRGQFLNDLLDMRHLTWRTGARIEGLVARREATRLIRAHFPDTTLFGEEGSFDISEYQLPSGGIAILPYANEDLRTTVMLIPFIKDDANIIALRNYLWNIANNATTENRMVALYGLALLGEPVLLELQKYALLPDLSVRNAAYVALGLAALGETQTARELYNNKIAPHIQRVAPYYRINIGRNRAEIIDMTSVAALLAARLGMPESMRLHNYVSRNRPADPQVTLERLKFISSEILNHTNTPASITYTLFGETVTRDLMSGGQFTLRIPAQNFDEFNLVSITGEVGAVSIIRVPLEDVEAVEGDVTIRREFFRAGSTTSADTFEQGDLIRVQITIDYSRTALTGSYIITDFLPAGLVHVPHSARFGNIGNRGATTGWWTSVTTEGQRITFFDFNGRFDRVHTYYYYARVVSPGTFTAEGTMIQSLGAREFMTVGDGAVITIRP